MLSLQIKLLLVHFSITIGAQQTENLIYDIPGNLG